MLKSRFRIAGEVLVIATLAGSAAAQSPRAPINTLNDLEAALLDCWVPPPIEQSRPGMQITVLMSFKRNGELFGQPRITFQSSDAFGRGARVVSHGRGGDAQALRLLALHGGVWKRHGRRAVHHALRR